MNPNKKSFGKLTLTEDGVLSQGRPVLETGNWKVLDRSYQAIGRRPRGVRSLARGRRVAVQPNWFYWPKRLEIGGAR